MSIKLKNIFCVSFVVSLLFRFGSFRDFGSAPSTVCFSEEEFDDAQIFLMQSAKINNKLKRQINVYWSNSAFQYGDTIAIYHEQPNDDDQPLWKFQPSENTGFIRTDLHISLLHKYNLTSYRAEVLVFCGAWLRKGIIRKVNCLSTHPTWMYDRKTILKHQRLSNLIIPGTYVSGMYMKTLPSQESLIETFTVTQNQDILSQFVHGARYLDIPIGHYSYLHQKYWVVDNRRKVMSLMRIIWDILFFVKGTKEIVMVGFRDFSVGFHYNSDHNDFVNYLKSLFSDHLLSQQNFDDPWNITTGEIWTLNKRVIIIYRHTYQVNDKYLWPAPWSLNSDNFQDFDNFQKDIISSEETIEKLFDFREKLNRELPRIIYLATSVKFDINQIAITCNMSCIDNHFSNSRRLGDMMAPIITQLYNERFYRYANIITSMFLDATALVDIAMIWNEKRAQDCIAFFVPWDKKLFGKLTKETVYFYDIK